MKKLKEFIFKNNKEKIKNCMFNEYAYNFEIIIKNNKEDYSKVYHYKNRVK